MNRKRLGVRLSAIELLEPRHMLAGNPLAEWRFDSNSGTVLVDSVGTSTGTITGSSVHNATATALVNVMPVWTASNATQWGTGTQNGALRLFSDTDGATIDAAVAPQVLSVSLWFKADTTNPTRYTSTSANGGNTSGTSVAMPLFESGDSASGLNIYIYNNRLYVGAWNSAVGGWSSGTFVFSAANAIAAGRWHHVVLTLDPTSALQANGLRGYLDGVQFGAGNGATAGGPADIGIGRTYGTTRFLLGTWDAAAEFKDIRVERDGKVLWQGDSTENAGKSEREGGDWSVDDGLHRQNRRGFGMNYFGDPEWTDYTLTLKARKLSGGEGFLIVFGRRGAERYWWNLGGWGNQQHAIELNQNVVGEQVRGSIDMNRWYDIKIELAGNRIRCYLDDKLIHDATSTPPERFFVTAGRDDADGSLVLKAINTANEPQAATLNFRGLDALSPDGSVTVLTSANLTDNNSLHRPTAVVPKKTRISIAGNEFHHEFPAQSLSIIRLTPKQNQ